LGAGREPWRGERQKAENVHDPSQVEPPSRGLGVLSGCRRQGRQLSLIFPAAVYAA